MEDEQDADHRCRLNTTWKATQTLLTRVPETTSSEFDQAVDAAAEAFKTWSRSSVLTRQRFVLEYVLPAQTVLIHSLTRTARLQNLLRQHSDAIASSIVLEQGKTLPGLYRRLDILLFYHSSVADAHGDLLRGLQVVETTANIPTALLGDTIEGTFI